MSGDTRVYAFSPMLIKDLHEVYYIEQDVFDYFWTYQNFMSAVAQDHECWVLRDEAEKLIGYYVAMEVVDEMHLLKIAVAKDFQKQGFGDMLMEHAFARMGELGYRSMLLEVRESNKNAVALYLKKGFETIGVRKNYYKEPTENALVMRKGEPL